MMECRIASLAPIFLGDSESIRYVVDVLLKCSAENVTKQEKNSNCVADSQLGVPRILNHDKDRKVASAQAAGQPFAAATVGLNQIDSMVIIDRQVDFMSVLCSQFTYEGLIDLCFGINCNTCSIPPALREGGEDGLQTLRLSNDNSLHKEIRDLHIAGVGKLLHAKTVSMQEIEAEKNNIKSIADMQSFMGKLKTLTQVC